MALLSIRPGVPPSSLDSRTRCTGPPVVAAPLGLPVFLLAPSCSSTTIFFLSLPAPWLVPKELPHRRLLHMLLCPLSGGGRVIAAAVSYGGGNRRNSLVQAAGSAWTNSAQMDNTHIPVHIDSHTRACTHETIHTDTEACFQRHMDSWASSRAYPNTQPYMHLAFRPPN